MFFEGREDILFILKKRQSIYVIIN
uniref:Uncharacterized protein n=1 Tax=Lepeophtheirus salmonis TaxID=72036 RepID=A0A0K2VLS0_LEPSM